MTQTALTVQRTLVYVAGFGAMLLLARRNRTALLAGTWASVVVLCAYALLTRLVPDYFGVVDSLAANRLAEPIGYWNSLGLLAAVGALLALGFAARSTRLLVRAAAGGSLPLLLLTVYFTYSRGAWLSLFAGLAVWVAVDRRRLGMLASLAVAAPWAAAIVAVASRSSVLTSETAPAIDAQAHAGHRVALLLVLLAALAATAAAGLGLLQQRFSVGDALERGIGRGLAAAALVAVIALFAVFGAPWTLASRAWSGFSASAPSGTTLNSRLFHVSSSGRVGLWQIAWDREVAPHPLLGTGGGTYERTYDRYRSDAGKVRNAHNLYLETLATLGPPGLLLLLVVFAHSRSSSAVRRRHLPIVPAALAAWVAFLVHVVVDWDWQITAVGLTALACAAALVSGGSEREQPALARRLALGAAIVAGALGIYLIAMQTTLTRIADAASPAKALGAARTAADLQPWSTEPWQRLAEADIASSHLADARAALATALAKDPNDWSLWLDRAEATVGIPRIDALHQADLLNPHSPEVAAFRATMLSLSQLSQGAKP